MLDDSTDTSQDPIVVLMEDALVHTAENPFCDDPTCPCHMDINLIGEANAVEGSLTYFEEELGRSQ